jgi:DNA polymerase-3 subunit beta
MTTSRKLDLPRKALVAILRTLKPLSKGNIKPILSNVQLRWNENGAIMVSATDLETTVTIGECGACGAEVEGKPEVSELVTMLVPAERLLKIATSSKGDVVTLVSEEPRKLSVDGTVLMCEDPEEYPVIDRGELGPITIFTVEQLRKLLACRFAVAAERSRFAFNGMRLQTEGPVMVAVATDGKRMAVKKVQPLITPKADCGHIVAPKGLDILDGWLKHESPDDEVHFSVDTREARFLSLTNGWMVSVRLVDGAFPKYESVIPKDITCSITFERQAFIEALKKAKATTNEANRSVRLIPDRQAGTLTINSTATDVGETNATISVKLGGVPMETAFNPDFLLEGLEGMSEASLTLEVSGKDTPALIRSEAFAYCIMPVTMRNA